MFTFRPSAERGRFDFGWLQTHHTFSFGEFDDPAWRGFHKLRVMNEDVIAPGGGFGMHPHRNMEIVTYVISGSLRHEDSLGNGGEIGAGEWQRMTAGSGILHSEANPSAESVHLYQIWIQPSRAGLTPSYDQKRFTPENLADSLTAVVTPDGANGSLRIEQDASIYLGNLLAGKSRSLTLPAGRAGWLQVVRGSLRLGSQRLTAGDAMAVAEENTVPIEAESDVQYLWFDLP